MTIAARITRRLSAAFTLDVDVEIPPGITILFGASGSGKSTLLRCIAGLTRPDTGRITIGGRTVFDAASGVDVPPRRRRVGMVFQQLALFPHMTVRDNIGYGLDRLTALERRARITAIAESFHIDHVLDRRPSHISGGERQRTALARTLVTEPEALLLDEPLSALDHAIQSRIIDDLRAWNAARRIPVLYVTHSHREVYALGERVIVIDRGSVAAAGTPHDVLEHPPQPTLARLAGFENLFEAQVIERSEATGTMRVQLEGGTQPIEVPLTAAAVGDRVAIAIRAGDILVATEVPRAVSARNVVEGTLAAARREGATVVGEVDAGVRFVVHLTPGSYDALGLRPGGRLWMIVKTYSCRIATP